MPFQNRVNTFPPLAVAGDFASANPRAVALAGDSALIAGPGGVTVGQFAWVSSVDGKTVNNFPHTSTDVLGFVHREQQALISIYLAESSLLIPAGFPVTLQVAGDFFDLVQGATAATIGAACYAAYNGGGLFIGALPAGITGTASIGATFTATAAGNQLTTSAVTGLISVGDTIAGAGVPAGTTILNQVSGTTGGAGVYTTSVVTTATAVTVTSFGTVLNVGSTTGVLTVGDSFTGTGVPAGAFITSQVSGPIGGIGVYTINVPAAAYAALTAITVVTGVLTKWVAKSICAVGELAKISTWGN
jgi:hypothetical protein